MGLLAGIALLALATQGSGYVMLTANIQDVKNLANDLAKMLNEVSMPEPIKEFWNRASYRFQNELGRSFRAFNDDVIWPRSKNRNLRRDSNQSKDNSKQSGADDAKNEHYSEETSSQHDDPKRETPKSINKNEKEFMQEDAEIRHKRKEISKENILKQKQSDDTESKLNNHKKPSREDGSNESQSVNEETKNRSTEKKSKEHKKRLKKDKYKGHSEDTETRHKSKVNDDFVSMGKHAGENLKDLRRLLERTQ